MLCPRIMEPESSLQCSQQPAIFPFPELQDSSAHYSVTLRRIYNSKSVWASFRNFFYTSRFMAVFHTLIPPPPLRPFPLHLSTWHAVSRFSGCKYFSLHTGVISSAGMDVLRTRKVFSHAGNRTKNFRSLSLWRNYCTNCTRFSPFLELLKKTTRGLRTIFFLTGSRSWDLQNMKQECYSRDRQAWF
jgi:hypothetical protein